jgi:arginyl-tRNA synthetase
MAPQRRFLMVAHNIFAEMLDRVRRASDDLIAAGVLPAGIDQSRVTVEPPRDPAHGDMATNAAMVLAKDAGKKPRELAEVIAQKLRADDLIGKVEVAGPGFINLTLKPSAWITALRNAVQLGPRRICLGESHRTYAYRSLPRRGVRRRAG